MNGLKIKTVTGTEFEVRGAATYLSRTNFLRGAYEADASYAYLYTDGKWLCARPRGKYQLTPLVFAVADPKVSS